MTRRGDPSRRRGLGAPPDPRHENPGWTIFSYLLSGMIVYGALGWILGRWIEKAGQRRRRYYRLTATGASVLASQRSTWREFADAINRIAGVENA